MPSIFGSKLLRNPPTVHQLNLEFHLSCAKVKWFLVWIHFFAKNCLHSNTCAGLKIFSQPGCVCDNYGLEGLSILCAKQIANVCTFLHTFDFSEL